MSSKSQLDALKELDILTLNSYVNADATGIPPANIDSLLQDMSNEAWSKRYKESGAIQQNRNVDTGMPPDVALSPLISKISVLKFLKKGVSKLPKRTTEQFANLSKSVKDSKEADWIIHNLTRSEKHKNIMKGIPDNPINFTGSVQKELTLQELSSDPGFRRFMYTNHGEDYTKAFSKQELLEMKESYKQVIETTLKDPQNAAFKSTYSPKLQDSQGSYHAGVRSIELNAYEFDKMQKRFPTARNKPHKQMYHSTAMHEFDHKAKLYDDAMTMRDLGEDAATRNYNILKPFQKEGRVGRLGMLKWEKKYEQALMDGKYFTPKALQSKESIKSLNSSGQPLGKDDQYYNYLMKPREISARIAELREDIRMFGGVRSGHPILKELKKILSKDGIKFALDNLWGAAPIAPIVPMLNLEEELGE